MRPSPGICDRCGTEGLEVLAGVARLRYWFVNGGGFRAQVEVCRNCGSSGSRGGWLMAVGGLRTWRMPLRLFHVVRRERNWHPVPIFYAYVGAAAAGLAAVPAVFVRRPGVWRWPPAAALGAMISVFALSVVSALRSGGIGSAIREVVVPQRAREERWDRVERLLREQAADLPVLVPATWDGPVALGGHGVRDPDGPGRRLTSLSVVAEAGPEPGSTPSLTIEHEYEPIPVSLLQGHAVTSVVVDEPTDGPPDLRRFDPRRPEDRAQLDEKLAAIGQRRAARERELAQRWRPGSIRVDGEDVPASLLPGDGAGAVVFEHAGVAVTVICVGVDPAGLDLATTQDLALLIEGMRRREGMVG